MKQILILIRKFFTKKEKFVTDWPKDMVLHQYQNDKGIWESEWIPINGPTNIYL